ncbi:MAG TPA: hypothetical protein VIG24_07750 [Acidimicrobiia bacterium]
MATIKENGIREFTTIEEAVKFVTNLHGRVRFSVKVDAFLPTEGEKGFPGMTFLSVSRSQMCDAIRGMGRVLVDERGGRIRLHLTAAKHEGSLAFVSFY